jgi:D-alanyl-lipoteichoic acid acyltransferase DltB (MBOAT superfamily)
VNFGSLPFLLAFLPGAFLLHWAGPRTAAFQNAALLLASWLFYASWNPRLLAVLVLTGLADFTALRLMDRVRDRPARLRAVFLAALALNVGQLLVFKYMGFFAESLAALLAAFGLPASIPVLRFVVPVGLSFFTIQHVAYLTDVYFGREPDRPTLPAFLVFSGFFAHVLSGPIPRGRELLPQLAAPRSLTAERLASAGVAFLLGYTLKHLAGESFGRHVVDPVFAAPGDYSALGLAFGVTGYAFQVFGDFAGYSLMALGLGRAFGLDLPENFRRPFLATSLLDLWRRWHITLNRFLFDYLYWPLVGSKGFWRGRFDLGFLLVFAVSGLWHGATWGFVLWGALHGLGLAVHRRWDAFYRGLCKRDRAWVARRRTAAYVATAWALTQGFFVLTLLPFRAPDLATAAEFASGLLRASGLHHPLGGQPVEALATLAALLLLLGYHLLATPPGRRLRERFFAAPAPIRGLAYGALVVLLLVLSPVGSGAFIYAQF